MPALGRRSAGAARLVLFPFAGGGASAFKDWQAHFPDSIETYALQYPGRETRWGDAAYAELSDLAVAIADEFVRYLEPPFAFLGHSMGAVVAFEVTRLLDRREQALPVHLFVAGVGPNREPREIDMHIRDDEEFLGELRAYGGLPDALLANAEFIRLALPVVREDFRLYERHMVRPGRPLPIPITAFGGTDDNKIAVDSVLAWESQTSRRFSSHFLPGGHFFLFLETANVAVRIRSELQRSISP